ncbi:MAG: cation:proton antiporter [Polyangiaceae bacterium]|nr:cation:proton antiporter [Polyangiaceae bacterium]
MGHIPLIDELALIAGLGVIVTLLLGRLRLPTVAGLLFAGALLGPNGFAIAKSMEAIEVLAELGVVFLLFTIGLEFSLSRLREVMRQAALGGLVQVGLTAGVAIGIAIALGQSTSRAVFYGFVFALSSTAIVLRALAERREMEAPHGRFIVGTLIFQDLCVVPMVLIVSLLGSQGTPADAARGISFALGKATLTVVVTIVVARWVVPRALAWVDAARSREIFLLAILAICIGTAWLTSLAGLSLALGAFLGGMVVADTDFGHRALGDVTPLRDAFVSLFFVSLGMLFDYRIVFDKPVLVTLLTFGFLFGKGALATIAAFAMRFPARVAWLAGVGLAQFGEFGFVLTRLAQGTGLVGDAETRPLLAAGVISMFLTPVLVRIAPHVSAGERLLAPLERMIGVRSIDAADQNDPHDLKGHVVLVGFGVAGRLVTQALAASGVQFVVIELNAATVRAAAKEGLPVYYGDATSEEALGHAHLAAARALVIVMNDPQAQQRVLDTARRVAPKIPIFARARYLAEGPRLRELGANDVIADEVEGGVEMVARVLRELEVPGNVIHEHIETARAKTQASARATVVPRRTLGSHRALADLKIESVLVREGSPAAGRTARELDLRHRTGALLVAIQRDGVLVENPDPSDPLGVGDVVYLVGSKDAVASATRELSVPPAA